MRVSLAFLAILTMLYGNESYAQKKGKNWGSTACPNFDAPRKLDRMPRGGPNIKRGKKMNTADICAPELRKDASELDARIKKLDDEIKQLLKNDVQKFKDTNDNAAKDIADLKKRKIGKKRYQWDPGKGWCISHSGRKYRCFHLFSSYTKQASDKKISRIDHKIDGVESQENADLVELLQGNYEQMLSEFKAEYNKLPEELKRKYQGIPSDKPYEEPNEEKWEQLLTRGNIIPNVKKSYLEHYMAKHFPEVTAKQAELEQAKLEKKRILDLAKRLCSGKDLNACPEVKNEFALNPTVENFEKMLKTLGKFRYTDKQKTSDYDALVTLDNYETDFNDNRKYSENKAQIDKIEQAHDKAEKAFENYQWNQQHANDPDFKAKPVISQCGSCADLKKLITQASADGDHEAILQLAEIDKQVHCNAIKQVDNCGDKVNAILKKNQFTFQGDQNSQDKRVTFAMALESYMKDPNIKANFLEQAFIESNKLISNEGGSPHECVSCQAISDQLAQLTDEKYESTINKETNEAEYKKVWSLKVGQENKQAAFEGLRNMAMKAKCIEPGQFDLQEEPSCKEKTSFLRDIVQSRESMDDVSFDEDDQVQLALEELTAFQQEKKLDCCDDVVGDLTSDIFHEASNKSANYVRQSSPRLAMAELMSCVKCGVNKVPEKTATFDYGKNPHTSCELYKKSILGKKDSDVIAGYYKADGSPYTVGEFKSNEIYTCADGPKKSQLRPNQDWDVLSYSPHGKYGDLYDLNLQCITAPRSDGSGLISVNLTCCDLKQDDPYFLQMQSSLSVTNYTPAAGLKGNQQPSIKKWLAVQEADKRANTFCKDVYESYRANGSTEGTKGWQVCVDKKDRTIYKVDDETKFFVDESSLGTFAAPVIGQ